MHQNPRLLSFFFSQYKHDYFRYQNRNKTVSHTCDVDIRLFNHDGYNDDCNADDFDDDGGKREEAQQTIWQFSRLDCR